mmetsp:Transcript_22774/g.55336  ORF Transcript_22774/g.55336 Transcript_22774/m.55336 type:complete len:351 (-) Transcript_22774:372-1424(-)
MTVPKLRLVLSPNKKRNVKRPIIFEWRPGMAPESVVQSLLKFATKKLCFKARGLFTIDGTEVSQENVLDYLESTKDGSIIIVTRKKGERVPVSPNTSPSLKPTPPPVLRRRESHEDHLRSFLSPIFERNLGSSIINIISAYARNCAVFDSSNLPSTVLCSAETGYTTVTRIPPSRKKWKEKGSHKFTVLGYGLVQNTIHQITFRVDRRAADFSEAEGNSRSRRLSIGIVDPKKYRKKSESSYGIGDCSYSWGLGCDGLFRHRGKVIKLDGQGRTPSWKTGDVVGISINPMQGKIAFFVGRKQYRVNPKTVKLPFALSFGVSICGIGDQFTFLDWTEQPTMQFSMPKELRL